MTDDPSSDPRAEAEVFADLATLAVSPGYIHALSLLYFRDIVVKYGRQITPDDLMPSGPEPMILSELATLLGLLIRSTIDFSFPGLTEINRMAASTDRLLSEMHTCMQRPFIGKFQKLIQEETTPLFSWDGEMLREPVFYGGEIAHTFQYSSFARERYATDERWLTANKGFSIDQALVISESISKIQSQKLEHFMHDRRKNRSRDLTMLPGLSFTVDELLGLSGLSEKTIKSFLQCFSIEPPEQNRAFRSIQDYNIARSRPIITMSDDNFILFGDFLLYESIYESPFYWMIQDPDYKDVATTNRGAFTEQACAARLRSVFGDAHVYENVEIQSTKSTRVGEIDCLVVFGDQALVVQSKSKKMTIESRKGNDLQIKKDFKNAIQDAYDQAFSCALAMGDETNKLILAGNKLDLRRNFSSIFPIIVISEQYPALSTQSRYFLKTKNLGAVANPFVADIFTVDMVTEFLDTPLYLLSYLALRSEKIEKIFQPNEVALLGYHLSSNMWVRDDHDMVMVDQTFANVVDAALLVRRVGLPGLRYPEGAIHDIRIGALGALIKQIEGRTEPQLIELGLTLLKVEKDAANAIEKGINKIVHDTYKDRELHDFSILLRHARTGVTFHCSPSHDRNSLEKLRAHCLLRKYGAQENSWFGIALSYPGPRIFAAVKVAYPWKHDPNMQKHVARLRKPISSSSAFAPGRRNKVGRNDPCWCGSGRKFKHCCGK